MLFRISIFVLGLSVATAQGQALSELAQKVNTSAEQLREAKDDATRKAPAAQLLSAMKALVKHPDVLAKDLAIPITSVSSSDGKLKVFTWNVPKDDGTHRYHGLMVSRARKNIDVTEFRDSTTVLEKVEEREMYPGKWYGAIYYDILDCKRGGKTYYTLLGWKGINRTENQKVIEIISITGRRVRLGAPVFSDGEHTRSKKYRKVYRYAFQVKMNLSKNEGGDQIIMDHLAPSRADLEGQYAFYGPDLSYDSFTWDGREWFFERDVDAKGNVKDSKLWNKPDKAP